MIRTTVYVALAAALTACAPAGGGGSGGATGGISQAAGEQACQTALVQYHSVNDVRVVSSEPYQGGGRFVRASVLAGAGGQRELWQCIAYGNGGTGELKYLAPDGNADTGGGTPTAAEQACLRDVTSTTNNPDVSVIRSSFSEAGTEVIVGVGPQRAPWRCIAYRDGATDGIMSLTNEGSL